MAYYWHISMEMKLSPSSRALDGKPNCTICNAGWCSVCFKHKQSKNQVLLLSLFKIAPSGGNSEQYRKMIEFVKTLPACMAFIAQPLFNSIILINSVNSYGLCFWGKDKFRLIWDCEPTTKVRWHHSKIPVGLTLWELSVAIPRASRPFSSPGRQERETFIRLLPFSNRKDSSEQTYQLYYDSSHPGQKIGSLFIPLLHDYFTPASS